MLGVGLHHMVATGTCSSTGYSSNYGPVPYCPKGTGWWFLFLFGGILLVIIGAFVSGGSSVALLVPAIFLAIGIGALTVGFDAHASSGTKTFGFIFGGAFFVCGLIWALLVAGSGLRKLSTKRQTAPAFSTPTTSTLLAAGASSAPAASSAFGATATTSAFGTAETQPDAILGAYTAGSSASTPGLGPTPATSTSYGSQPTGDALDKIAKLSELHKSGALTDDEFNREKAKLLGEL